MYQQVAKYIERPPIGDAKQMMDWTRTITWKDPFCFFLPHPPPPLFIPWPPFLSRMSDGRFLFEFWTDHLPVIFDTKQSHMEPQGCMLICPYSKFFCLQLANVRDNLVSLPSQACLVRTQDRTFSVIAPRLWNAYPERPH